MEQENKFSVAVHYGDALGYIEFDGDARKAVVTLPDEEGRKKAEDYLAKPHDIAVPNMTLMDFETKTIDPMADVRSFQIAMTRIWEETEVYVDWSRPVAFVNKYPTLDILPKGGGEFTLEE
ncbi:MAG: hypothetical protein IJ521_04900 [Schwartzia sp.]|nr:hypothetical protein [Schwartzia sp. (in: firmicutes)]